MGMNRHSIILGFQSFFEFVMSYCQWWKRRYGLEDWVSGTVNTFGHACIAACNKGKSVFDTRRPREQLLHCGSDERAALVAGGEAEGDVH